ncbi:hypothetical protein [uncultured Clostridium sp.]|uniref:hypothetical protein n=1 Tax=uncultured Clostridium sp. TaxID=59620 RepID=UPI0028E5461E|nr:hypothetical protein [uncultured Clostridium sp.]
MNCCKKDKSEKKGPLKFIGMMGACCLLPIVLVAMVPLLSSNSGISRFIQFLAPLICPIMMGLMMLGLLKNKDGHGSCSKDEKEKIEPIE